MSEDLARFYDDPLGFVMWAFPWAVEGGQLSGHTGPRPWQDKYLRLVGKRVKEHAFDGSTPCDPIQISTTSGHGPGKSCMTAWLTLWIMSTRPFCKGTVTANTGDQLKTKSWAEVAKWHNMSINKEMFNYFNTRGNMSLRHNGIYKDEWFCMASTCREENSEAFAGQHSVNSTSFYIFDEGSSIPEAIYEVSEGGMTDGEPMKFLFGNPTRNSGYFRETFRDNKHRWDNFQIDSRDVEGAINVKLTEQWAEDYGEDSDFFKVRVKGVFPSAGSAQFIDSESIDLAFGRHLRSDEFGSAPVILGVDVARYGDDSSVIMLRQGLMSKKLADYKGMDLMTLANRVAEYEDETNANAVFIDVGMGAGVIDRLRQLGRNPIEVSFGGKSNNKQFANKRSEMWNSIKQWLKSGGALPRESELRKELIAQEYCFKGNTDKILMVSKEDMKKITKKSSDFADALALTFAEKVSTLEDGDYLRAQINGTLNKTVTEYDLFAD